MKKRKIYALPMLLTVFVFTACSKASASSVPQNAETPSRTQQQETAPASSRPFQGNRIHLLHLGRKRCGTECERSAGSVPGCESCQRQTLKQRLPGRYQKLSRQPELNISSTTQHQYPGGGRPGHAIPARRLPENQNRRNSNYE